MIREQDKSVEDTEETEHTRPDLDASGNRPKEKRVPEPPGVRITDEMINNV